MYCIYQVVVAEAEVAVGTDLEVAIDTAAAVVVAMVDAMIEGVAATEAVVVAMADVMIEEVVATEAEVVMVDAMEVVVATGVAEEADRTEIGKLTKQWNYNYYVMYALN